MNYNLITYTLGIYHDMLIFCDITSGILLCIFTLFCMYFMGVTLHVYFFLWYILYTHNSIVSSLYVDILIGTDIMCSLCKDILCMALIVCIPFLWFILYEHDIVLLFCWLISVVHWNNYYTKKLFHSYNCHFMNCNELHTCFFHNIIIFVRYWI